MLNDVVLTVILSTLVILLLTATLILVFFIWSKQRLKQEAKLVEAQLLFEKELRQVEHEVREVTMTRFARELHDNIGQLLTAGVIQLENHKIDHPEQLEHIKSTEIYLTEAIQQLRLLSRTVNHEYLLQSGLVDVLNIETDRLIALKRFQLHLSGMDIKTSTLTKEQELMVFRIFQEAIQNILKYAKAKNVYIQLNTTHARFNMSIQDDGCGFDLESMLASSKANGLRNMQKRAQMANLSCIISSKPQQGCLIEIKQV